MPQSRIPHPSGFSDEGDADHTGRHADQAKDAKQYPERSQTQDDFKKGSGLSQERMKKNLKGRNSSEELMDPPNGVITLTVGSPGHTKASNMKSSSPGEKDGLHENEDLAPIK